MDQALTKFLATLVMMVFMSSLPVEAIDCYTCSSKMGQDRSCEDPAIPSYINIFPNCQVPVPLSLKPLNGTETLLDKQVESQKATHCIKIIGTISKDDNMTAQGGTVNGTRAYLDTHVDLSKIPVSKEDNMDKGPLEPDFRKVSIVIRSCGSEDMNSLCGTFLFQGHLIKGCIISCSKNLCNKGHSPDVSQAITMASTVALLLLGFQGFLIPGHRLEVLKSDTKKTKTTKR